MISATTYLRWSLVVPLAVPLFALALVLVANLVWGEAGPIGGWAIFLIFSLLIAGLPYLIFLSGVLLWSRGKSARAIVVLSLVAPPLFAVLFFVVWVAFVLVASDESYALDSAMKSGGAYAAISIGLGYVYVALVYVLYGMLRWLRKVEPITERSVA